MTGPRRFINGNIAASFGRLRQRRWAYVALLGNAMFAGITAVGLPVALNTVGMSKAQIAVFFVLNAGVAVFYNTVLMPRIRRIGYPQWILLATTAAVPAGVLIIRMGAPSIPLLYLGGVLMLFVSTTVPQIMGRVGSQPNGEAQETMVADLRQILIIGYIVGLIVYSAVLASGVDALIVAAAAASLAFIGAFTPGFRGSVPVTTGPQRENKRTFSLPLILMLALSVVALLKSVDTLRGIYLPLFAVSNGVDAAAIAPLFMASSILELAALPLLSRLSIRYGSALTLVAISLSGSLVFGLLLADQSYSTLLVSQLIYAIFGAGFQSIGLVLLAKVSGGDAGSGASAYMAVTQIGTVLGALLPLTVPGYGAQIFLIALFLSSIAAVLAVLVHGNIRRQGA